MEEAGDREPNQRHDRIVADDADQDAFRGLGHLFEIFYAELRAHAEHDNLEKGEDEPRQFEAAYGGEILRVIHGQADSGKDQDGEGEAP